jgi:hypothetical protein
MELPRQQTLCLAIDHPQMHWKEKGAYQEPDWPVEGAGLHFLLTSRNIDAREYTCTSNEAKA